MQSTMDEVMASSMVGVHGAVHGQRHGPPEVDDAFCGTCHGWPWHIPWTFTMGATMDSSLVHHGLCHGRRHRSAKCHGIVHGTYLESMDGAMVQSMDEWSSMAWWVASSLVNYMALSVDVMASGVHGIVRGRRHGIVHSRCHGRSKECRSHTQSRTLDANYAGATETTSTRPYLIPVTTLRTAVWYFVCLEAA